MVKLNYKKNIVMKKQDLVNGGGILCEGTFDVVIEHRETGEREVIADCKKVYAMDEVEITDSGLVIKEGVITIGKKGAFFIKHITEPTEISDEMLNKSRLMSLREVSRFIDDL